MGNSLRGMKKQILEEILGLMDKIAERVKELGDMTLEEFVLSEVEGQKGGWLGKYARDYVEEAYEDILRREEEFPEPKEEE